MDEEEHRQLPLVVVAQRHKTGGLSSLHADEISNEDSSLNVLFENW